MKPKTNKFHSSISASDDSGSQYLTELKSHLELYGRGFDLGGNGIALLCKGIQEAKQWRFIGEKRKQEKSQYSEIDDKKGRLDSAKGIKKALERIQTHLEQLSVSDESLIDNYIMLATQLHLEPRVADDNEQTLEDKSLLQRRSARILKPHEFAELQNPIQGRHSFALLMKQMELGIDYWINYENSLPHMRKSLDYTRDVDILQRYFTASQKHNEKQYAISPKPNTWFYRYCEYFFTDLYEGIGLEALTEHQISKAIQNYIDVYKDDSDYYPA